MPKVLPQELLMQQGALGNQGTGRKQGDGAGEKTQADRGGKTAAPFPEGEMPPGHEQGGRGPQPPDQAQGVAAGQINALPAFQSPQAGEHQQEGNEPQARIPVLEPADARPSEFSQKHPGQDL
jgi:hypothetical protein